MADSNASLSARSDSCSSSARLSGRKENNENLTKRSQTVYTRSLHCKTLTNCYTRQMKTLNKESEHRVVKFVKTNGGPAKFYYFIYKLKDCRYVI